MAHSMSCEKYTSAVTLHSITSYRPATQEHPTISTAKQEHNSHSS
jgi:hypothetical protein